MEVEAERVDAEDYETPPRPMFPKFSIETPDGLVRQMNVTPETAWYVGKGAFWIVAGVFGLGWALGRWTAGE